MTIQQIIKESFLMAGDILTGYLIVFCVLISFLTFKYH